MTLQHQIGGHPNVTTDPSGTLVIKPAAARETAFYQLIHSTKACKVVPSPITNDKTPDDDDAALRRRDRLLGNLKRFVPRFWGTLVVPQPTPQDCVILSNLTSPYAHPNIIDIKLGTVLFDSSDATLTAEKRRKMEEKARVRSVAVTGAAITGYQTWDSGEGRYEMGERAACGILKPHELAGAFTHFFASPDPIPPPSNVSDSAPDQPLTQTHLLRTLRALLSTLITLQDILRQMEIRFIGASLLIIYEGDPAALADAWQAVDRGQAPGNGLDAVEDSEEDEDDISSDEEEPKRGGGKNRKRSFFDGVFHQFGAERNDEKQGFGLLDGSPPSSPHTSRPSSPTPSPAPPFTCRLIDFAHTRLADGEGPDEGVLKGLETVVRLVRGRIGQLGGVVD